MTIKTLLLLLLLLLFTSSSSLCSLFPEEGEKKSFYDFLFGRRGNPLCRKIGRNRGPFRAIDTLPSSPIYQVQWHFFPPLLAPAPKHGRYFFGGNIVLPTVFCRMQLLSRFFFLAVEMNFPWALPSLKCFRIKCYFLRLFCGNSGNPLSVGANSQIFQPCDTFLPQDRWYPPSAIALQTKEKRSNNQKKFPYKFCVWIRHLSVYLWIFLCCHTPASWHKNRSILIFFAATDFP